MSEAATTEGTPASTQEVTDKPLEATGKLYDEAYVKELRQEAAGARIAKKEAVEAAVQELSAKHAAELVERDTRYTELENAYAAAQLELQKLIVAIDAEVPSSKVRAFAAILQGTDEASLTESAKSNLDLFGGFDKRIPGFDPTQGSGGRPKDLPLNGDPILQALLKAIDH